jgi:hypothetical protein
MHTVHTWEKDRLGKVFTVCIGVITSPRARNRFHTGIGLHTEHRLCTMGL